VVLQDDLTLLLLSVFSLSLFLGPLNSVSWVALVLTSFLSLQNLTPLSRFFRLTDYNSFHAFSNLSYCVMRGFQFLSSPRSRFILSNLSFLSFQVSPNFTQFPFLIFFIFSRMRFSRRTCSTFVDVLLLCRRRACTRVSSVFALSFP